MAKITFDNKVSLDPQPSIARENKVIDDDMNEIKTVVNTNAGVCDYSTSETSTGKTWINGKTIYRKVINVGTIPNGTVKSVAHNISNLDMIIHIEGFFYRSSDKMTRPFSFIYSSNTTFAGVQADNTNVSVYASWDNQATDSYVILEYTKTS
jgi:hypothetical protein